MLEVYKSLKCAEDNILVASHKESFFDAQT